MCTSIAVHSARPLLKDLQSNITPYYAAYWTIIGTQLGIHSGILEGIQASYPADAFRCCNKMLEIWLDTDCNATWDKIHKAIVCPGVTQIKVNLRQNDGKFRIIVDNYVLHTVGCKKVNICNCIYTLLQMLYVTRNYN